MTQRRVGASISRRQITDVLHEPDGAPELVLDLVAAESGEHATISMAWSRDDLEQLLESASGDDVVLVFDRDELTGAFDDVEAHGLRTHAAVFAVAAVGTLGAGASIANATVLGGAGAGSAATPAARPRPPPRSRRSRPAPKRSTSSTASATPATAPRSPRSKPAPKRSTSNTASATRRQPVPQAV